MSNYCHNCGSILADGAHFCPNCGWDQQSPRANDRPIRTSGRKRLHCPECHSTAISPVVETEVNGGTSLNHSFSRKNSVSSVQFYSTHRNYWMCSNCGHKFRNLQNLEEEIAALDTKAKIIRVITIIVVLLEIFLLGISVWIGIGFGLSLMACLPLLLIIILYFILKSQISKLKEEQAYLKRNCFG